MKPATFVIPLISRPPRSFSFVAALLLVATVASTGPASAQSPPRLEASGGYQYTHAPDLSIPAGWFADVAGNLTTIYGIVGEVSEARTSETVPVSRTQTVDVTAKMTAFLGGVRFSLRLSPRVVPFGQVLGGGVRVSAGAAVPTSALNVNVSQNGFALQSGGGVNIMASPRIGVRVAADTRQIVFSSDDGSGVERDFRFVVGLAFSTGN